MKKGKALLVFILITLSCTIIAQQSDKSLSLPKEVKVGKEHSKNRNEIKIPDIDGYKVLKCDFHMHTIFSDGIVWPSLRVLEAWEEGLDAISITDHIEGQPVRTGVTRGNHNYSYEAAEEEAKRRDIILIRGGEITRAMPPGHLNAIFLTDVNELDQKDYMTALEEANKQGAFIFWNHPGWGVDEIKWYDVHETLYQKGLLHGIEVFNEFEWYPQALLWAKEKGLTLIGNTDVHDTVERLYDFKTTRFRPMTLVLSKNRTAESIKEALFAKRTILYFYDMLMGDENLLKRLFEESVVFEKPHYKKENRNFITVRNLSSISFKLKKTNEDNSGAPEVINIPGGETILIALSNNVNTNISYTIENTIIGVDEKLTINIF